MTASGAAAEGIANFYLELGAGGTQSERGEVIGFFDESADVDALSSALGLYIIACRDLDLDISDATVKRLPVEDWSVGWKKYFKPVRAGRRCVVKPPWEAWTPADDDIVIDINPALAFGTGTHETTRLCLRLLEDSLRPGDAVLDAGTGSGILSIAAVKLGAGSVLSFDIDADALGNAFENVQQNGVADKIELICSVLDSIKPRPFDVICANINRLVLIDLIPQLRAYVTHNTNVLISGLLDSDAADLEAVFKLSGFYVDKKIQEGMWMGYRLIKT